MNYIDTIASRIHEVIVERQGHDGSTQKILRAYAGLVLIKGAGTTMEDVHNMWAVVASEVNEANPYIVPMNELPPDIQEYDRPFMEAIHAVAEEGAA